ncbi:MAG: hypothetical protein U5K69_22015 [Balneolaceae bacterium]|nr:hypothetical protein [Balneolaceae bacterium]
MAPDKQNFSRKRQSNIYIGGVSGARPAVPVAYTELRKRAKNKLSEEAFAYLA